MATTFLERNKKKSALAALLLFLRQRKMLALLLLLMIGASTLFLTPSSFLVDLPGGARMAAGMAWIASRMGIDVTRWGLAGAGRISFGDLLAEFSNARNSRRGPGWGPFFRGEDKDKAASGAGSLDYVKGSRSDLADAGAKGASGAGTDGGSGPIQSVVDPDQAAKDGAGVVVGPNDLGGQREGFVKAAFAGGFFNGLVGGAGDGANALSGGAYAGHGFFSGSVGVAANGATTAANRGLQGAPTVATPPGQTTGGVTGRVSARFAQAMQAREIQGAAGALVVSNGRAYTQLAQGNAQAQLATADCGTNCPGEFAATNTGAIYDGNSVNNATTNGVVTAAPVDGITTPNMPNSGQAAGLIQNANSMDQEAQTCQALDAQYGPEEDSLNSQMQSLSTQFSSAGCGSGGCSQSKFNYCNGLGNQMKSTCSQYMSVRCQHTRACPLTAANSANVCTNSCQQGGNGISSSAPDVIQGDTSGNTDGQGASSGSH